MQFRNIFSKIEQQQKDISSRCHEPKYAGRLDETYWQFCELYNFNAPTENDALELKADLRTIVTSFEAVRRAKTESLKDSGLAKEFSDAATYYKKEFAFASGKKSAGDELKNAFLTAGYLKETSGISYGEPEEIATVMRLWNEAKAESIWGKGNNNRI